MLQSVVMFIVVFSVTFVICISFSRFRMNRSSDIIRNIIDRTVQKMLLPALGVFDGMLKVWPMFPDSEQVFELTEDGKKKIMNAISARIMLYHMQLSIYYVNECGLFYSPSIRRYIKKSGHTIEADIAAIISFVLCEYVAETLSVGRVRYANIEDLCNILDDLSTILDKDKESELNNQVNTVRVNNKE